MFSSSSSSDSSQNIVRQINGENSAHFYAALCEFLNKPNNQFDERWFHQLLERSKWNISHALNCLMSLKALLQSPKDLHQHVPAVAANRAKIGQCFSQLLDKHPTLQFFRPFITAPPEVPNRCPPHLLPNAMPDGGAPPSLPPINISQTIRFFPTKQSSITKALALIQTYLEGHWRHYQSLPPSVQSHFYWAVQFWNTLPSPPPSGSPSRRKFLNLQVKIYLRDCAQAPSPLDVAAAGLCYEELRRSNVGLSLHHDPPPPPGSVAQLVCTSLWQSSGDPPARFFRPDACFVPLDLDRRASVCLSVPQLVARLRAQQVRAQLQSSPPPDSPSRIQRLAAKLRISITVHAAGGASATYSADDPIAEIDLAHVQPANAYLPLIPAALNHNLASRVVPDSRESNINAAVATLLDRYPDALFNASEEIQAQPSGSTRNLSDRNHNTTPNNVSDRNHNTTSLTFHATQPASGLPPWVGKGFKNDSNFCYLNSLLQALMYLLSPEVARAHQCAPASTPSSSTDMSAHGSSCLLHELRALRDDSRDQTISPSMRFGIAAAEPAQPEDPAFLLALLFDSTPQQKDGAVHLRSTFCLRAQALFQYQDQHILHPPPGTTDLHSWFAGQGLSASAPQCPRYLLLEMPHGYRITAPDKTLRIADSLYRLVSIVSYAQTDPAKGTGHYKAYVCRDSLWVEFNDACVERRSPFDAERALESHRLLFYSSDASVEDATVEDATVGDVSALSTLPNKHSSSPLSLHGSSLSSPSTSSERVSSVNISSPDANLSSPSDPLLGSTTSSSDPTDEGWSVAKWLTSLGYSELIPIFEANDIFSPADVKALTADNLKTDMGITKVGPRNKILIAAQNL